MKKTAENITANKSLNAKGELKGGPLGVRKQQDLPSIFIDVVPNLKKGQVSRIIRSASGLHLVKVIDSRGGGVEMVAQTNARHILLKPTAIRTEAQALEHIKKLRQRALAGEDFGALAKEFSDDIGSAREGGDLGWSNPGMFAPEFEKAMDNTAKGEISPPTKTTFGWHIIQVLDRREQDMTEQMRRSIAHDYLFQKRYDEQLDVWLQQIRDEAYVEIK